MFWFRYTTDSGSNVSVYRDKSNSTALAGTTPLLNPVNLTDAVIGSNVKCRYVNTFLQGNPIIRRRFPVGSLAAYTAITNGTVIAEGTNSWVVTSKRGEKTRFAYATDTGQTT